MAARLATAAALLAALSACAPGVTPPGTMVCRQRWGVDPGRNFNRAWAFLQAQLRGLNCNYPMQFWSDTPGPAPIDHLLAYDARNDSLWVIRHRRGGPSWTWLRVDNITPAEILAQPATSPVWPAGTHQASSAEGGPPLMYYDLASTLRLFGFADMIPMPYR